MRDIGIVIWISFLSACVGTFILFAVLDPDALTIAFARRFARWGFRAEALTPVYGLSEAALAVSFSDPRTTTLSALVLPKYTAMPIPGWNPEPRISTGSTRIPGSPPVVEAARFPAGNIHGLKVVQAKTRPAATLFRQLS